MAAGNAAPEINIERVKPGDPDSQAFTVQPEIVEKVEQAQRMEALRDIHLPDGVSPWPPAPGWWASLVLAFLLALAARAVWNWLRRPNLRRIARREFDRLCADAASRKLSPVAEATQLVEFLRRLAAATGATSPTNPRSAAEWLEHLRVTLRLAPLDAAVRLTVTQEIYRPEPAPDLPALKAFVDEVLAALPRDPHAHQRRTAANSVSASIAASDPTGKPSSASTHGATLNGEAARA